MSERYPARTHDESDGGHTIKGELFVRPEVVRLVVGAPDQCDPNTWVASIVGPKGMFVAEARGHTADAALANAHCLAAAWNAQHHHEQEELVRLLVVEENALLSASVAKLVEECDRLREAILWACGMRGKFPIRQEWQGAYYWRKELRERAGISYEEIDSQALAGGEER